MKAALTCLCLAVSLAPGAAKLCAAEVELPETEIYSADWTPAEITAVSRDSNICFVEGPRFRITTRARASGPRRREFLEDQARKVSVRFEPSSGTLEVSAPRLYLGCVDANVTVELTKAAILGITTVDGNVALSKLRLAKFSVKTQDGNVALFDVENSGNSSVATDDGDVSIHGSVQKLGKVNVEIKGDGKLHGRLAEAGLTGGQLRISTEDGDVDVL